MVTVRGMTASEFQANLQQVRGLLDPVTQAAPAPTQGQEGYCAKHQVPMKLNHGKDGKSDWYSHRHLGEWCQGKGR